MASSVAPADEIWEKLQGFASFGFPESHSVSFAYIVYAAAWLKYHWPAEFYAGLLNAQPMGFYTPNSLIQDAQHHGVVVLIPDVNRSAFDCTIEPIESDPEQTRWNTFGGSGGGGEDRSMIPSGRLSRSAVGLRYVRNLGEGEIARVEAARMQPVAPLSPPRILHNGQVLRLTRMRVSLLPVRSHRLASIGEMGCGQPACSPNLDLVGCPFLRVTTFPHFLR